MPIEFNNPTDVFVKDLITGTLQRPAQPGGAAEPNAETLWPALSGDGSVVTFSSDATDLVSADTNATTDVFTRAIPAARRAQSLEITGASSAPAGSGAYAVTFTVHNSAANQVCVPYLNAVYQSIQSYHCRRRVERTVLFCGRFRPADQLRQRGSRRLESDRGYR